MKYPEIFKGHQTQWAWKYRIFLSIFYAFVVCIFANILTLLLFNCPSHQLTVPIITTLPFAHQTPMHLKGTQIC